MVLRVSEIYFDASAVTPSSNGKVLVLDDSRILYTEISTPDLVLKNQINVLSDELRLGSSTSSKRVVRFGNGSDPTQDATIGLIAGQLTLNGGTSANNSIAVRGNLYLSDHLVPNATRLLQIESSGLLAASAVAPESIALKNAANVFTQPQTFERPCQIAADLTDNATYGLPLLSNAGGLYKSNTLTHGSLRACIDKVNELDTLFQNASNPFAANSPTLTGNITFADNSTIKLGSTSSGGITLLGVADQDKTTIKLVNIKDARIIATGPPVYATTGRVHASLTCPASSFTITKTATMGAYPLAMHVKCDEDANPQLPTAPLTGIAFAQSTRASTNEPISEADTISTHPSAAIVFVPDQTNLDSRKAGQGDIEVWCRDGSSQQTLETALRAGGTDRRVEIYPERYDESVNYLTVGYVNSNTPPQKANAAVVIGGGSIGGCSIAAAGDVVSAGKVESAGLHVTSTAYTNNSQTALLDDSSVPYSEFPLTCTTVASRSTGIAFGDWNGKSADHITSNAGAAIVHIAERSADPLVPYSAGLQPGHLAFCNKMLITSATTQTRKALNISAFQAVEFWPGLQESQARAGLVTVGVAQRTTPSVPSTISGIVHIGKTTLVPTSLSTEGGVNVGGNLKVTGTATFDGDVVFGPNVTLTSIPQQLSPNNVVVNQSLQVGSHANSTKPAGAAVMNGTVQVFGDLSLESVNYYPVGSSVVQASTASLIVTAGQLLRFKAANSTGTECSLKASTTTTTSGAPAKIELSGTLQGGTLIPDALTIPRGCTIVNGVLGTSGSLEDTKITGKVNYENNQISLDANVLGAKLKLDNKACIEMGNGAMKIGPSATTNAFVAPTINKVIQNVNGATVTTFVRGDSEIVAGDIAQMSGALKGGTLIPDRIFVGYGGSVSNSSTPQFLSSSIKNVILDGCISIGETNVIGDTQGYLTCGYAFDPETQIYIGRDMVLKNKKNIVLTRNARSDITNNEASRLCFDEGTGRFTTLEPNRGTTPDLCAIKLDGEMFGGTLAPQTLKMPTEVYCGTRDTFGTYSVTNTQSTTNIHYAKLKGCTLTNTPCLDSKMYVSESGGLDFSVSGKMYEAMLEAGECTDFVQSKRVNCVKLVGIMAGGTLRPDRLEIPTGTSVNVKIGADLTTTTFKGDVIVDSLTSSFGQGIKVMDSNCITFGSIDAQAVVLRAPTSTMSETMRPTVDVSRNSLDVKGSYGIRFQNDSKLTFGTQNASGKIVMSSNGSRVCLDPQTQPLQVTGNKGIQFGADMEAAACRLYTDAYDGVADHPVLEGTIKMDDVEIKGDLHGGDYHPDFVGTTTLQVVDKLANAFMVATAPVSSSTAVQSGTLELMGAGDRTVFKVEGASGQVSGSNFVFSTYGKLSIPGTVTSTTQSGNVLAVTNQAPIIQLGDGVTLMTGMTETGAHGFVSVSGGPVYANAPLSTSSVVTSFCRSLLPSSGPSNRTLRSRSDAGSFAYFDMVGGRPALRTVHPYIGGIATNPMELQVVVTFEFLYKGDFGDVTNQYASPFTNLPDKNYDDLSYEEAARPNRVWRLFRTCAKTDFQVKSKSVVSNGVTIEPLVESLCGSRVTSFLDDADHFGSLDVGTWKATIIAYRSENVSTQNTQATNLYALGYYGPRVMSISQHVVLITPNPSAKYGADKLAQFRGTFPTTVPFYECNLGFATNIMNNTDASAGWGPFSQMSDI